MKRTVTTALIAAFLMVFGLSTGAFAQGMGHMGMGHMGMGMGGTQLSPEKQAAIQKIYQEQGQTVFNLQQQLMAKQYELNAQLSSPTPDEKRTPALTKEVADLNGKLLDARASLQKQLAKEGVPNSAIMACPMMGTGSGMGMMNCPMMGGMGHGGGHGMMSMGCPMMGGGQWW